MDLAIVGSEVFRIVPSSDWINIAVAVTQGKSFTAVFSFFSITSLTIALLKLQMACYKV